MKKGKEPAIFKSGREGQAESLASRAQVFTQTLEHRFYEFSMNNLNKTYSCQMCRHKMYFKVLQDGKGCLGEHTVVAFDSRGLL